MSRPEKQVRTIHISDTDEYLASRLMDTERGVIGIEVSGTDPEGNIRVCEFEPRPEGITGEGTDFDLSPCECAGLGERGISELVQGPVHTSSAYEFLDLALSARSPLRCLVSFTGSAWKIAVVD